MSTKIPAGFCPTIAENGVMIKGVVSGGGLTSSPAYNVEPVTNTSSSSCADDGRRGECSTLAAVRRGFVFDTSRLLYG